MDEIERERWKQEILIVGLSFAHEGIEQGKRRLEALVNKIEDVIRRGIALDGAQAQSDAYSKGHRAGLLRAAEIAEAAENEEGTADERLGGLGERIRGEAAELS